MKPTSLEAPGIRPCQTQSTARSRWENSSHRRREVAIELITFAKAKEDDNWSVPHSGSYEADLFTCAKKTSRKIKSPLKGHAQTPHAIHGIQASSRPNITLLQAPLSQSSLSTKSSAKAHSVACVTKASGLPRMESVTDNRANELPRGGTESANIGSRDKLRACRNDWKQPSACVHSMAGQPFST